MPPSIRKPLEDPLARIMFGLSVLYLVLLAALLHRYQDPDINLLDPRLHQLWAFRAHAGSLLLLWIAFVVEGLWRLARRNPARRLRSDLGFFILVVLFPPLRIGARSLAEHMAIWLPRLGWREVDRELRRQLERFFSVPMIFIALMVLPLLAIHFFWSETVEKDAGLAMFLDISNGLIWFAFAIEFVIMISVAKKRLLYCTTHWVELAIILLPLLQFLPFLPLLRLLRIGGVLRLEQLTRMSRLYRLQGLALKMWRAVLLLEVVQRITGQTLERRLRKLQDLSAAKEEELDDLRREIEEIRKRLAQQKQAAVVRDADPERQQGDDGRQP